MNKRRIITYALEDDFIGKLADFIESEFIKKGADLSRIAIVFGGKRPSLFLKRELSRRMNTNFFPPHFFTVDSFIDYVLNKKDSASTVSEMEAAYYVYTVTKNKASALARGRNTFSDFLPWAYEILSFIDQLDMEAIDDKKLAAAESNARIGYDVPDELNKLLRHITVIRGEYHRLLRQRGKRSRGLRYCDAADAIDTIDSNEYDHILFCNLLYLHETERKIIKTLYGRGATYLFFQGNACEWNTLTLCSQIFSAPIEPESKSRRGDPQVELHGGFDVHSQVSLIGKILKDATDNEDTVIVLPKADAVIPLVSEIASREKNFNVSMGYPLRKSALFALFNLIFKAQNTTKGNTYYAKDYLAVIRHPLLKNMKIENTPAAVMRVLVHKIEEILLGIEPNALGGTLFIRLHDIEKSNDLYTAAGNTLSAMGHRNISSQTLQSIVVALHDMSFVVWESINTFSSFASSSELFLNQLIKKLDELDFDKLNLSIIEKMFGIIDEYRAAEYCNERFEREEIFSIYLQHLEKEKIRFQGSPLKGLQILGFLETRSLNFNKVIIMDMNEGVFPNIRRYMPLIPRDLMIGLGLTRFRYEEEIQHYYFMRLVRSAREVHLVYNGSEGKEKSRFIEELIWDREKRENILKPLVEKKGFYKADMLPKKEAIRKKAYIVSHLKNNFTFSASSIDTYIHCPLQFYYKYVLRLREKEDFLEDLEAADIGTFLHDVLEIAFTPYIGKKPVIDKKFHSTFTKSFNEYFDKKIAKKMKSDSFMIKEIMIRRFKEFFKKEKERNSQEVIALEKQFDESLMLGEYTVPFTAKVDRIDRCHDGSILIIDYKSGTTAKMIRKLKNLRDVDITDRKKIGEAIQSFQLPLYIELVKKHFPGTPIDAVLYTLRDSALTSYADKVEEYPFKESMAICMRALNTIIDEIYNPAIPFAGDDSDERQCMYCPFKNLCS
ncbi:MAG: PD-(D/E)XK nuclease family protein [Candidatus Omnitrophica bacterium]|nr:PD-(D/E)XK nuclease family protein [Candidatus Omnitrophota bacterium]